MPANVKLFVVAGLLVAAALGLFASPLASSDPDGLAKVAEAHGLGGSQRQHPLRGSPVAGYSVRGIEDGAMSRGVAGLIGVLVTFGVGLAAFAGLRLLRDRRGETPPGGPT